MTTVPLQRTALQVRWPFCVVVVKCVVWNDGIPHTYSTLCCLFFQLYRDCLRLVKHVAPGHSRKAMALRHTVRMEFDKNRGETNPQLIELQKANAIRALSNYMLFESGNKDLKVKKAMEDYHTSSVEELKKFQKWQGKWENYRRKMVEYRGESMDLCKRKLRYGASYTFAGVRHDLPCPWKTRTI